VIVADNQNSQRQALGSGFLVSRDRIATNRHVVEGMKEAYVVFSDGAIKRVSSVVADSIQQDLIILTAETGNRPPLPFGDELSLQQGDPVYALGAPKGLELSFTNGIVSSFRKSNAQFLIQTTAPIAPGYSGGPLFDRAGRVVGVTTSMISDAPGIYFSVGVGDLRRLLRTPRAVALPFEEWVKQQGTSPSSESATGTGPNQSEGGQATTPTLEETVSWMESFAETHGIRYEDGNLRGSYSLNPLTHLPGLLALLPDSAKQDRDLPIECAIVVKHSFPNGIGTEAVKTKLVVFTLNKIDPASIVTKRFESSDGAYVDFESSDPLISMQADITYANGMAKHFSVKREVLYFDSEENANRFANAFRHAINLCGGTKAPF